MKYLEHSACPQRTPCARAVPWIPPVMSDAKDPGPSLVPQWPHTSPRTPADLASSPGQVASWQNTWDPASTREGRRPARSYHRLIPTAPRPRRLLGAATRVLSGFVRVQAPHPHPLLRARETTEPQSYSARAVPPHVSHCHLAPVALMFSFLGCGTRNWGAGNCDFSSFRCLSNKLCPSKPGLLCLRWANP